MKTQLFISSSLVTICLASVPSLAQGIVPPGAVAQFEHTIGNRVEAVTILGGDYGAAGGIYTFRSGQLASLSITKFGGGGDVSSPMDLGLWDLKWAPVVYGNIGRISAENEFESGYLVGNRTTYSVLAIQFGGGARFFLTDHFSISPTIGGMYGHTENEFKAFNTVGETVKILAKGTFVDWQVDTWSVIPAIDLKYEWTWWRTQFTASTRYTYFHTESFKTTSPVVSVTGDSHTWETRLDADVPIGVKIFGRELHTGGFFSRTQLFGGIKEGLDTDHINTLNGRFVLDFKGKLWKVRWLGLGASYFFASNFDGWSVGADVLFEF